MIWGENTTTQHAMDIELFQIQVSRKVKKDFWTEKGRYSIEKELTYPHIPLRASKFRGADGNGGYIWVFVLCVSVYLALHRSFEGFVAVWQLVLEEV